MSNLKRKDTKIDNKIKDYALKEFKNGKRVCEISRAIGYSQPTIKYWVEKSDFLDKKINNIDENILKIRNSKKLNNYSDKIIDEDVDILNNSTENCIKNDQKMPKLKKNSLKNFKLKKLNNNNSDEIIDQNNETFRNSTLNSMKNVRSVMPKLRKISCKNVRSKKIHNINNSDKIMDENTVNFQNSSQYKIINVHSVTPKVEKATKEPLEAEETEDCCSSDSQTLPLDDNILSPEASFCDIAKEVNNLQNIIEELKQFLSVGYQMVNRASNCLHQVQETLYNYEIRKKIKLESL